jgi:predicted Zn-dependent peptidase
MKRMLHTLVVLLLGLNGTTLYGQLDRTVKPGPGPASPLNLPVLQKSSLDNGLKLIVVEHHELPVVQVTMVILSGSADDPAGKAGLATLTAQMMDEGTATRDALAISEEIDFLGANLSVRASTDASFASLLTLKEHLDAALGIFADVVRNPVFPEHEWDRVKKTHLTGLLQQKDQPGTVASKVFARVTFGADHPYGRPDDGTEESVEGLTADDLKRFYSANYVPNNAAVIVVGDVTPPEVQSKMEHFFGTWKAHPLAKNDQADPPMIGSTMIYLVDKPEAAQSEIRIGHTGVRRDTKDYFALQVMNTILGGQFSSRINMNLRETKGYTYGARSGFQMWKESGLFTASAAVKSAVTDSSVIEFMKELKRIREEDVTGDEFMFAKNSLIRREPQGFETPAQIAGQISSLVIYNLPDDYFRTYVQNFASVTIEDVRMVARKYLNPAAMNIVIVGDQNLVGSGLERLGYGPVRRLDAGGNPLN